MKVTVLNQKGKEVEVLTLDKNVFGAEVNNDILAQYVYVYLSNQREANANTKTRAEVSGGGKKPWKQKGTGQARVGSSRNPVWRKGGVVFGPLSERNYKKTISKKMKNAAMASALSKVSENIKVVDVFAIDTNKALTKQVLDLAKALEIDSKATFVTGTINKDLVMATSNAKNLKTIFVKDLNVYDILNSGTMVLDKEAVVYLTKKLAK